MAQRRPRPSNSRPSASKASPAKATPAKAGSAKANTSKGSPPRSDAGKVTSAARSGVVARTPGRPPARKPGKSIVNQNQTPWGLIGVVAAVVVFAAAIVVAVVVTRKSGSSSSGPEGSLVSSCQQMKGTNSATYLNENVCASKIKGVTFKPEPNRQHLTGHITYDSSPPVGGNHNGYWADCTGTIYPKAIANENAVHMLEHGAIWITYRAGLPASQLAALKKLVNGQDRMALSPYPGLKSPISLQAWGYQLFVNNASDPRIAKFVNTLRYNPQTTPELNATCSQPNFKLHPSTFGHPLNG
jgi:hypothetical protein